MTGLEETVFDMASSAIVDGQSGKLAFLVEILGDFIRGFYVETRTVDEEVLYQVDGGGGWSCADHDRPLTIFILAQHIHDRYFENRQELHYDYD